MTDLALLPLADLSRQIAARRLSSTDLTRHYLDRIAAIDPHIHSYITVAAEMALTAAARADVEMAAGHYRGPLHGIPIGIKDLIDVADTPTTAGAAHRQHHVAAANANVVAALRRAGVVILGKQATTEYAVGGTQFDLPWPPVRNPWNLACDASSSSSGSAAATAAGLCAASIGTETAGSIRAPAAWCGVAGLKPTDGLVSRGGVLPLSRTMDCVGPICRTARDCALLLPAMISTDAPDCARPGFRVPDPSRMARPVAGLHLGIPRHVFEDDPDLAPEVRAAFAKALDRLRDLGCRLSDVRLDGYDTWADTARAITWPEEYAEHRQELCNHPDRFGPVTRSRLHAGLQFTAPDYILALRHRSAAIVSLIDTLTSVDLLVLPTMKAAAQPLGYEHQLGARDLSYTRPFNLTGTPALTIPMGFSTTGLPLSLQFIGRPFDDDLVLACGSQCEAAISPALRLPTGISPA